MPCAFDQFKNPLTGRCVKKDGELGRKIMAFMRNQNTLPQEMTDNILRNLNIPEAMSAMSALWYRDDEIQTEMERRPRVFLWKGKTLEYSILNKNKYEIIRKADIPRRKNGHNIDTVIVFQETIPENAFYRNEFIKYVIGSKVKTIGNKAFYRCKNLTTVDMPLVKTIGNYAFWECDKLTNVTIPKVETIRDSAFVKCKYLTTVDMPLVKTIGNYTFYECENLTTVDMPQVKTIGNSAFVECKNLTTVIMPQVETIGEDAFMGCEKLTNKPKNEWCCIS